MSRNAFVPMAWITSDLSGEALRTLIAISFFADASTGECWPTNAKLSEMLGKTKRNVQNDIKALSDAGLISIHDGTGKNRKFRIESPEWFDRPRRKTTPLDDSNHVENRHRSTVSENDTVEKSTMSENDTPTMSENDTPTMSENDTPLIRTHPMNTPNEHSSGSGSVLEESKPTEKSTTTTSPEIEPFESGLPATLPEIRNGIAPFRNRTVEIVPTKLKPETVAMIFEVLGTEGDQFARKITQEQADAGFPDWVLSESRNNRTPVKLAFHLLRTAWREGWTDPQEAENARLEEMADMIRNLK